MTCDYCGDEVAYCGGNCRLQHLKAMTMPETITYPEESFELIRKAASEAAPSMGVIESDLVNSIQKVAQAMSFTQPSSGNSSHLHLQAGRKSRSGFLGAPGSDPGVRHPRPASDAIHDDAVERITRTAMGSGLNRDEVLTIVREVYAQALVEDQDQSWVEKRLRNRLKDKVREQFVGYDESEDLASMSADEFMGRVQPPKDLYLSWDDVASRAAQSFWHFWQNIERLREVGYGPVIEIYSDGPSQKGFLHEQEHAEAVIHCALAGVEVRFRVRQDLAAKMDRAAAKQKFRDILDSRGRVEEDNMFRSTKNFFR